MDRKVRIDFDPNLAKVERSLHSYVGTGGRDETSRKNPSDMAKRLSDALSKA